MISTIYDNVRPALDMQASLVEDSALVVKDGRMYLRNRAMGISQPIESKDFSCSAAAFDHAVRRIPNAKLTITDKTVTVKGGGQSSRLKQLGVTNVFDKPDLETHPVPANLVKAVTTVLPFAGVGDKGRPWTMGARVDATTITATNAVLMCQADIDEQSVLEGVTLPYDVLTYIVQRGVALTRWGADNKLVLLEFEDGGWAAIARMGGEMPASVLGALTAFTDPSFVIEDDYRSEFLASVNFTEDELLLYADHVYGARLAADYRLEIETPVSVEPAAFSARDLTLVVRHATKIGFDKYPAPTPFAVEGGIGLLAGRSQQ